MTNAKNYKAGANRHWQAIKSSNQFWSNRQPLFDSRQILTAKDGRRYVVLNGKAHFLKGSVPTK
jgi:hypothetical protein